MANRRSRVTLFRRSVQQLTEAQTAALEKTVEALHTEVQQAQVMPRDTGALQNEKTFVDKTNAKEWKSAAYIRRTICQKALLPSGI